MGFDFVLENARKIKIEQEVWEGVTAHSSCAPPPHTGTAPLPEVCRKPADNCLAQGLGEQRYHRLQVS